MMACTSRTCLSPAMIAYMLLLAYLFLGMFIFYILEAPNEVASAIARFRLSNQSSVLPPENITIDPSSYAPLKAGTSNMTARQLFLAFNQLYPNMTGLNLLAITPKMVQHGNGSTSLALVVHFSRVNYKLAVAELLRKELSGSRKWNLVGSFFFATTVVTTIGYGNLSPATMLGKICCVLYAVPGIPLWLVTMSHIREMLEGFAVWLEKKTKRFVVSSTANLLHRPSLLMILRRKSSTSPASRQTASIMGLPFQVAAPAADDDDTTPVTHKKQPWTVWAVFLFGYLVMLTVPAGIFSYMEGWDYLSSLYYNFVTLKTIGFGDLIAGNGRGNPDVRYNEELIASLYRIYLSVYIVVGLPFANTMVSLWRIKVERLFAYLSRRSCCSCCQCTIVRPPAVTNININESRRETLAATTSSLSPFEHNLQPESRLTTNEHEESHLPTVNFNLSH